MTGPDDDTDDGGEDSDGSAVLILHLDPDETVRSRLAAVVDEADGDVTYEGTATVERARERLDEEDVDVLVVEPDAASDVTGLVTDADVPVALYTSLEPNEIDPAVSGAADTLVEKWTAEEGLDFVVEKLLGAVRTAAEPQSRFTRAFERVDPDTQSSSSFLVYEDGTVIWETTTLEAIFDRRDVSVSLPETPNFYKQLSAALSHDPEAIRTIRGSDVPDEPTRFTVPTADSEASFRYSEHEFPETVGPLRLVVVEDVTWSARSGARYELLELLDRHVQDGISVVDANGRVQYHNESFADLLGHEDMVGDHTATFMADGELEAGQRLIQRLRTSSQDSGVIDMTFETADGDERTLAVHFSVREADDGYEGLVNVARDVTERRDHERTLDRYRRLVESAGDPMYVVDDDCRIEICNEALASLFDRSRESLHGTRLTEFIPEEAVDRTHSALERARETGESATCEVELPGADGEARQFEATVAGLGDADATGSVGILHEVTDRERRESELDLLKQVLTRVLRHDVRTGLTVVRGQAEVLAERTTGEEREMAETIVDRSEELVGTAEKARAIERVIDSDEGRVTLDLRSVVNRCVANVSAAHSGAGYDVQITEQVPVRVHRAFPYAVENLIENAVEHCAEGHDSGTRESEGAHSGDGASVTISATADDDGRVLLRIEDDGPGISQEELDVLDEREETPLKHGTGVGLWLVSWVVERSGGELSFDADDDGTTVTVRLDAGDAEDVV
ncbi:PAS domain S-box protein [Halosimplex amylolyticum]|uniref:PAS domain S-box protein n=1 Tax=Halosimplex amylolyticum TaxID=3396616 RepID=UPI003F549CB1